MATINLTGQTVEPASQRQDRILAVTSPERLKGVPEIQTQSRRRMPGMVAQLFMGLFLPARTSRAIVRSGLPKRTQKTMNEAAMQEGAVSIRARSR
jgi:tripartite-type tricarboxylate transporter receptor subunit TctC